MNEVWTWKEGSLVDGETHQWRMDAKWLGNCFLLGSSSLANHDG